MKGFRLTNEEMMESVIDRQTVQSGRFRNLCSDCCLCNPASGKHKKMDGSAKSKQSD